MNIGGIPSYELILWTDSLGLGQWRVTGSWVPKKRRIFPIITRLLASKQLRKMRDYYCCHKSSQHQYWIIWCSPNLISWRIVLQKPTVVQLVKNSSSLEHKIKYCGHKRSPLTSIFIYLNPLCAHNLPHVCSDLAAPWLVACLSLRQHDFNHRSIYVWISGRKSGTGTSFSPSTEVFPCKYHQPMLHSHSRTCQRRCMCLAVASLVK